MENTKQEYSGKLGEYTNLVFKVPEGNNLLFIENVFYFNYRFIW